MRDSEYISGRVRKLELAGRRSKGGKKRRFMDVVKEEMKFVDADDWL